MRPSQLRETMPRYHNDLRNYHGQKFSGLTVADLRELIDGQPDDAIVVFTSDYGDYHHTQQALTLKNDAEAELYDAADVIEKSGYSHSGFQFNDPDERDEDEEGCDGPGLSTPRESDEEDVDEKLKVVVIKL
jgi:hypothetical protein